MEGVSSEAASLAGHLGLGRLIYLYDDNHISIEGGTYLAFSEDRMKRFEAYGWHTQIVADDPNDEISAVDAIDRAIQNAKADPRPSIIAVRTVIGYGLPTKQGTEKAHGEPAGQEELDAAKRALGWPIEPRFYVPNDMLAFFRQAVEWGELAEQKWDQMTADYEQALSRTWVGTAPAFERRTSGWLGSRSAAVPRGRKRPSPAGRPPGRC